MTTSIFTVIRPIVNAYTSPQNGYELINVTSHLSTVVNIATFFKLISVYSCDMAIYAMVVDSIENEYRFTVIYSLQSISLNYSLNLITKTKDGLAMLSMQGLYPAFNWAEREIWDLSGVFFTKHPDLRRILTDYGFSGHPLRKDFPISGFREAHYSDSIKQIVYTTIELSQSYRLTGLAPVWDSNA